MQDCTIEQLEGDIDDDGCAPSHQGVETDYARCDGVGMPTFEDGAGYLSVIGDYRDRFIEIRVQPSTLRAAGWVRRGEVAPDAG